MGDIRVSGEPSGKDGRWRICAADIATAALFLTRLPLPHALVRTPRPLKYAMWAFPVIGAGLGAVAALALICASAVGIPALAAIGLALATGIILTGGLHEDGLADTADGLGGGGGRERKLEIMRDSRIGSYGVLALFLLLLTKAGALLALADGPHTAMLTIMMAAAGLSRALVVWLMHTTSPARPDGLSAGAGQPTQAVAMRALAIALLLTAFAGWSCGSLSRTLMALGIAALSMLAIRTLALRQIGGQTGDICGALQAVSETAMLVAMAARVH
jgi:adenosylcobinamide-GDP ribazoletransferase